MEPTIVKVNEPNNSEVIITIPTIKIDNWLAKYLKSIWFWFTISSVTYIGYNLAGYPVQSECWNDARTNSTASAIASVFGFFTPLGLGFRGTMFEGVPIILVPLALQFFGVFIIYLVDKHLKQRERGFLVTMLIILLTLAFGSIVASFGISIAILFKGEYPAFCM
jgi:hypothetical protein